MNRRSFFKTFAAFVATAAVFPREALNYATPEPIAEPLIGFIPCDGRVLRRMDYPELFKVIENFYGGDDAIEGSFCVPDLKPTRPVEGYVHVTQWSINASGQYGMPVGMIIPVMHSAVRSA